MRIILALLRIFAIGFLLQKLTANRSVLFLKIISTLASRSKMQSPDTGQVSVSQTNTTMRLCFSRPYSPTSKTAENTPFTKSIQSKEGVVYGKKTCTGGGIHYTNDTNIDLASTQTLPTGSQRLSHEEKEGSSKRDTRSYI